MNSAISNHPSDTVRSLYDRIFAADEEGLKALLADDLVVVHQGVNHPGLPFYGEFHGIEGFFQWLKNLFDTVELNLFEPTYFVSGGPWVNVHVREGSVVRASQATHSIENFHAFHINDAGRIRHVKIISDPLTVFRSLEGKPGEHFEPKYKKASIEVGDYPFDRSYNDALAEKALDSLARGEERPLHEIFAVDADLVMNGDEAAVPFSGKFSGMAPVSNFMQRFSLDSGDTRKDYIVSEGNKTDVHFSMKGGSSVTGREFSHDAVAAFQYNTEGRIASAFFHVNTLEIQQAYLT
jgi:ketosteroid isomerase-like protein